jgi:hypothetical protein
MRHVSALERARREADITRQLAAIVEVTMEYLANEHRRKLRTDRRRKRFSGGSSMEIRFRSFTVKVTVSRNLVALWSK